MNKSMKAKRRDAAPGDLTMAGLQNYEIKNNGAHIIIHAPAGRVDYWPGTGKYRKGNSKTKYGFDQMIQECFGGEVQSKDDQIQSLKNHVSALQNQIDDMLDRLEAMENLSRY